MSTEKSLRDIIDAQAKLIEAQQKLIDELSKNKPITFYPIYTYPPHLTHPYIYYGLQCTSAVSGNATTTVTYAGGVS